MPFRLPRTRVRVLRADFAVVLLAAALGCQSDVSAPQVGYESAPALGTWREPAMVGAAGVPVPAAGAGSVSCTVAIGTALARARKSAGVVSVVLGACVLLGYLQALPVGARLAWEEDYHAAARRARDEHRPLLVDFSASWCGACQELEHDTFADPRIVREGEHFVRVRVDLSPGKDTPEKRELLARHAHRGLPLVVLHKASGEPAARVTSFVAADRMLALMRDARRL